jgi:hypothetical protein
MSVHPFLRVTPVVKRLMHVREVPAPGAGRRRGGACSSAGGLRVVYAQAGTHARLLGPVSEYVRTARFMAFRPWGRMGVSNSGYPQRG